MTVLRSSLSKTQTSEPIALKGFSEIEDAYDLFLCDLWGVIHNGMNAFEGALSVLSRLKDLKKPVYFLSNAPRRLEIAQKQLVERGVPHHLYEGILTSGEDCFEHLKARTLPFYQKLGTRFFHMGPERDLYLIQTLSYSPVDHIEDADFILNTGVVQEENLIQKQTALLKKAHERNIPMVCANPDHFALSGSLNHATQLICAGYIAHLYEQMGGCVHYHGKPSVSMFDHLYTRYNLSPATRAVMIGDSFRTDITGAWRASQAGYAIESIFVQSGIHQATTWEDTLKLVEEYAVCPTYVIDYVKL